MSYNSLISSVLAKGRNGIATYGTFGILALSLGLNVFLGLALTNVRHPTSGDSIKVGTRVPPLAVRSLTGQNLTLTWTSSEKPLTMIYLFSPSCIWCERNYANLQALANAHDPNYRLITISATSNGLGEYVKTHNLGVAVYSEPVATAGGKFQPSGTPETLVIGRDGVVKRAWSGAFTGEVQKEVEAFLGVKLPGLTS